MILSIASKLAFTKWGLPHPAIAISGSFNPCPVSVQTIVEFVAIFPFSRSRKTPATDTAEAGSQKIPSFSANNFWVLRMRESEHSSNQPPDSSWALHAYCHDTGEPIRIAVAIVSGLSIFSPLKKGAAPEAWYPKMVGLESEIGLLIIWFNDPIGQN